MNTPYSEFWDRRFLHMALTIAKWSKDPHKGVGCVLVSPDRRRLSYGYNGFPHGIEDTPERLKDDNTRLAYTVHAELNALLNAPFDPTGFILYSTQFPCHGCAKAIIQKRIAKVVAPTWAHRTNSKWLSSWAMSALLLDEAGINVTLVHFGALEDHLTTGEIP